MALCDYYVPLASQTLFLKRCALWTDKSLVVIDSKVLYLMEKMVFVVKCSILQGKGKKIILLRDFTQWHKIKSLGIISLT